jgi:hypothetical protein
MHKNAYAYIHMHAYSGKVSSFAFQRFLVRVSVGLKPMMAKITHAFNQQLQVNIPIVPTKTGHHHFPPTPLQPNHLPFLFKSKVIKDCKKRILTYLF